MIIETSDRLPSNNYKLSSTNIQIIIGAYKLGQSGTSLAKTYRVAPNTIYYHLRRNNVATRGRTSTKVTKSNRTSAALSAIARLSAKELKVVKKALNLI